ncbi:glycosyltransferase family 2 protein [Leeuwenhoekiella sp. W20_SRS_FM14]|uniref:glycosyltransferase family 2 protein n=1 Tax=Leeuwenhoekiella sp. W20_SRS_FM14 TaxID=3240270 RepID=UPI003F95442E
MKHRAHSVIISTYNAPKWLEKTLVGYTMQTYRDFELVIADDGSGAETKQLIEAFKETTDIPIIHVWHKDNGFQKSAILNKALKACNGEYIIMSDGDCIPRKDFVEQHVKYKQQGYFLSGGYHMLPLSTSRGITNKDIELENCFNVKWLQDRGMPKSFKNNKIDSGAIQEKFLNFITPTKPTWNGHNASGWKSDILAVNGFDERMQYGGQDRELGERLVNHGVKGKQIRYSAICLHLDHPRGYKNKESINKNKAIRKETKKKKIRSTPHGIVKD